MAMDRLMEFDYFYGAESEQFSFIRLPKLLFTDRHFKSLSFEAKIVYGILLDRMSLSVKNNWIDEKNRVYITFSVNTLAEEIGCSRDKAGRILSELDVVKGIGLVERKRRGLGRPDIIYVKNFIKFVGHDDGDHCEETDDPPEENDLGSESAHPDVAKSDIREEVIHNEEKEDLPGVKEKIELSTMDDSPGSLENTQMSDFTTSRSRKLRHQEAANYDIKKSEITTSGCGKLRHLDVAKSDTNNTNINNTEYNDTDLIQSISFDKPVKLTLTAGPEGQREDMMDDKDPVIKKIRENIRYDWHMEHDSVSDKGSYRNYFEIMKNLIVGEREKIRIGDAVFPYTFVKERLLSITEEHIYYVMQCVEKDKDEIKNMKAYMTVALFNAPETIDEYYKQLCTYNMEGDGWYERKSG